jgi:hypothetical protein
LFCGLGSHGGSFGLDGPGSGDGQQDALAFLVLPVPRKTRKFIFPKIVPNHDLSPVGIFDGQGVIGGATPFTPTFSLFSWRINTVLPPQRLFNQIGAAFFLRVHPFNEPLGQFDGDWLLFQLWRHRLSARA